MDLMTVLAWIVLGLIAGFLANMIVNKGGGGLVSSIILGIVGAVVGGFLSTQLGGPAVTGFNITSVIVATVGAIVVLVLYHLLMRGRRRAG